MPETDDAERRSDVGLREVIEAVWCPAATGVTVGVGPTSGAGPRVESYFVIPRLARPRALLPADSLTSARAAISAYRSLRTARAEAWSRLVRLTALSAPPAARLLRRLDVYAAPGAERLLPTLTKLLDRPSPLRAMLAIRRPSGVSKPTLGLFDASGTPVAYAKLGRSDLTDTLVRTEAATLRELAGRLPTVVTPTLRAEAVWQGHPVTLAAPLPADARRLGVQPLDMPDTLREVAASGDLRDQALGSSSYLDRMRGRLDATARIAPVAAEPLRRWFGRLSQDDSVIRFGRSHGDWVSWNLGSHQGRVVAWDWELSVRDAPVGFDACHWHFQRARASGGIEAAAGAVDSMAGGLVRLGVSPGDTGRVSDLYLFDACVGAVEAAAVGGPELAAAAALARRRVGR